MVGFIEQRLVSRHTNVNVPSMKYQIYKEDGFIGYQQSMPSPPSSSFSPPFTDTFHKTSTPSSSSGPKISPVVLFIIVILAVLLFISGLLHLLVRFLTKHYSQSHLSQSNRFPDGSPSDTLQRQHQQLFHLHDSGFDRTFIDALPVFMHKEVVGAHEPFDCAVCLSDFLKTINCDYSQHVAMRFISIV